MRRHRPRRAHVVILTGRPPPALRRARARDGVASRARFRSSHGHAARPLPAHRGRMRSALKAALRRSRSICSSSAAVSSGSRSPPRRPTLGVETTVLEVAPRILARVCDEETGAIVHAAHRTHGVDIRVGTTLESASAQADGRIRGCDGFRRIAGRPISSWSAPARSPMTASPAAAGLTLRRRHRRRRTLPDVGPGDLRRRRRGALSRARTGSSGWRTGDTRRIRAPLPAATPRARTNLRHGAVVLVGAVRPLHPGRRLAGAGQHASPAPARRLRRRSSSKSSTGVCYAMGINVQRDLAAARRLIERRVPVDPAALADPAQPSPAC